MTEVDQTLSWARNIVKDKEQLIINKKTNLVKFQMLNYIC